MYAPDTPVLVAVVPSAADWQRVRDEGWYRIPLRRAPTYMGASLIAWYLTHACGDERWQVRWYAPIERARILTRRELLPDQADHPRAGERYWRIDCGPLAALPRPIPARRWRRVTFIPTRWERLLHATDVVELWQNAAALEELCQALTDAGYAPARRRLGEITSAEPWELTVRPMLQGARVCWPGGAVDLDMFELTWAMAACVKRVIVHLEQSRAAPSQILLQ